MGCKAIKEKYQIKHIVAKYGDNICIGSPYVHDIITISPDGKLIKVWNGIGRDDTLERYLQELHADEKTGELKRLFHLADAFENILPVYTYSGGKIIKKFCEKYGWPELTTDGDVMYENTYCRSYSEAYKMLLSNTKVKYTWRIASRNIRDHFKNIGKQFYYIFTAIYEYAYARTIQRIIGLFK
jgi:hypothetical protein